MTELNLPHTWTGVIHYGKNYRRLKDKEIYFELEIKQDGEKITGISMDTGGFGASPDPATIKGEINENKISFIKQYSSRHFLNSKGEMIVDKSQPGPEIFYTGIYNDEDESFSGDWLMKIKFKLFKLLPLTFNFGGSWTMKRK
jgi:hypothetical protein